MSILLFSWLLSLQSAQYLAMNVVVCVAMALQCSHLVRCHPSNNVLHLCGCSEVFSLALSWKFPYYESVTFVGLVFIPAIIFVLCAAVSVCSALSPSIVVGKRLPVCGDSIMDAIQIHFDGI